MLRSILLIRGYHTTALFLTADKQLLSKLRKSTGFPFVNCRKALEKFNNDIKQAETWLREEAQKEGWAKASKLQGRAMSHGLVGVTVQDRCAVMVEVNCETDFVARNAKFQNFVSLVCDAFLQHGFNSDVTKMKVGNREINGILCSDKTVADLTALEVGNIGENIAVRRGVFLRAVNKELVASYVHSTGLQSGQIRRCSVGKYGSLVLCDEDLSETLPTERPVSMEELGRQLCLHIVGMNPQSIGAMTDNPSEDSENEVKLIHQEFMLDTNLRVLDVLQQNGAKVLDFVRFECGEVLSEEFENAASVSSAS